ncbi:MAG: alkene reductase [Rhodocyclaceae bacterium]|nr:alkene reductase [Rhodocyclaceae bacterium]
MLFDAFSNNTLTLNNRIVMAPMTRCRAVHADPVATPLMVKYYAQRASAGLIITEALPVSDRARGYVNTPALWSERHAESFSAVTDAVHKAGGKIFAQIWHVGRIAHSSLNLNGLPPLGVSAKTAKVKTFINGPDGGVAIAACEQPVAATLADIKTTIEDFAQSARMAKLAGFDGVEIHAANGYLLDQFRCPTLNDRTDIYGGSLENRFRLTLDVVDAVSKVYAPGCISVRQSPYGNFNDMVPDADPLGTYTYIADQLQRRKIGFLHLFDQGTNWIHDNTNPLLPALRKAYNGALIACGSFDQEKAEAVLKRGQADLVAFGKNFIPNPDLVRRMKEGLPLAPVDMAVFYAGGEKGYADYPEAA